LRRPPKVEKAERETRRERTTSKKGCLEQISLLRHDSGGISDRKKEKGRHKIKGGNVGVFGEQNVENNMVGTGFVTKKG